MEQHFLTLQRFYLRWLCAAPIPIFAILLGFLLSHWGISVLPLSPAVVVVGLAVYYYATAGRFLIKGSYGTEDGQVVLTVGEKRYVLTDVREIMGDVKTIYGARYAKLSIEGDVSLKLFSEEPAGTRFEDTPLFGLYEAFRRADPALQPVMIGGQPAELWLKKSG